MKVTVELTYAMGKIFGANRLEVENAQTVADVVDETVKRFGDKAAELEKLSKLASVAINGVLVNYRKGMKTKLNDGDVISFVKAAAGG